MNPNAAMFHSMYDQNSASGADFNANAGQGLDGASQQHPGLSEETAKALSGAAQVDQPMEQQDFQGRYTPPCISGQSHKGIASL